MQYTLRHINTICNGSLHGPDADQVIAHVMTDSRNIIFPQSSVFIAIRGPRFNGHDFIPECLNFGIENFIVDEKWSAPENAPFNYIRVKNTVHALHKIAAHHRSKYGLKTIAITGSNGKTTVKEWLYQILMEKFKVVKSPRSFNSQIGVPLSLLRIDSTHEVGIFEAGISKKGEMKNSSEMIACDLGIFTNLGNAHDEGFDTKEQKLEEKLLLFNRASTIIYNLDDDIVDKTIKLKFPNKKRISWSWDADRKAVFTVKLKKLSTGMGQLRLISNNSEKTYGVPFTEHIFIHNLVPCIITAIQLDLDQEMIQHHLHSLSSLPMRLEMKSGLNDCLLINDSYNADLPSLQSALRFATENSRFRPIRLILSDIIQSGQEPNILYQEVANALSKTKVRQIVTIGNESNLLKDFLNPDIYDHHHFDSVNEFFNAEGWKSFTDETILLKGARPFAFERIFEILSEKAHTTRLEIDLSALAHNLRTFSSFLKPEVKLLTVIKASAYGSGAAELARFIEAQQVDYLAVAYADEGVDLRKNGIQIPIIVLNPELASIPNLIRYNLEPEIYSLNQLKFFINYLSTNQGQLRLHLKLETGMHRLGIEDDQIPELKSMIQNAGSKVIVESILSHLSSSDDPKSDDYSRRQFEQFEQMYEDIITILPERPLRHILNTTGIVRFSEQQYEMVRLGIGMYGIDPSNTISDQLMKVHNLKSKIAQIKHLAPGESVGYNNRFVAKRKSTIATIRIGYADGFLRAAGNNHYSVLVNGKLAPIVGNICMDLTMIDITDLDDIHENDDVLLFGSELPIETLAEAVHTIPYEILSRISPRVKRVFVQD